MSLRNPLMVAFTQKKKMDQRLCLINRLSFLGKGAQAAAGRRQLAARLEGEREETTKLTTLLMYMAKVSLGLARYLCCKHQLFSKSKHSAHTIYL
jgi:hypothetical protein